MLPAPERLAAAPASPAPVWSAGRGAVRDGSRRRSGGPLIGRSPEGAVQTTVKERATETVGDRL